MTFTVKVRKGNEWSTYTRDNIEQVNEIINFAIRNDFNFTVKSKKTKGGK